MKNVIKFLFVFLLVAASSVTYAQTFGVRYGLNLSQMNFSGSFYDGYDYKLTSNPGINIGATVEYPVKGIFSIESGLTFSAKGSRWGEFDSQSFDVPVTNRENLYYLQLPVAAKATMGLGNNTKVFGYAGMYAAYALWGKDVYGLNGEQDITAKFNMDFGSTENDYYKRFDYGAIFGAGVQINCIEIGVSYDLGLANVAPVSGSKAKNGVLGFFVGYKLTK